MMQKIIAVITAGVLLSACQTHTLSTPTPTTHHQTMPQQTTISPSATASVAVPSVKRVWRLSQLGQFTASQLQNTLMDWTALPSAYAHMGCNNLRFQANLDGKGSLNVSHISTTRMMCPDEMPLENAFASTLKKMTAYRVESTNTLVLYNEMGDEMRFVNR